MAGSIEFYTFQNTPEQFEKLRAVGVIGEDDYIDVDFDEYVEALTDNTGYQWFATVSFMKAAISDMYEKYVPGPVTALGDVFPPDSNAVVITPTLITSIMVAMNRPNRSIYKKSTFGDYGVAKRQDVKRFLKKHEGEILVVPSM